MKETSIKQLNVLGVLTTNPTKLSLIRTLHAIKRRILIGLAFAALALSVPAAETKRPQAVKNGTPSTLTGKILSVDRTLHVLAVEVKGKLVQINLVAHVKIARGDKLLSYEVLN